MDISTHTPHGTEVSINLAFHSARRRLFSPLHALLVLFCCCIVSQEIMRADAMSVRYQEGVTNGFLVLRTLEGKRIADGDLSQVAHGDQINSHLIFQFKDGSWYEETTVFSQRHSFRVLSDHVIQKGPSFQPQMDAFLDATTGNITVRFTDKNGVEKTSRQKIALPSDLANGILLTLLKNIDPRTPTTLLSYIALSDKPRLVNLAIAPEGEETVLLGGIRSKALRYVVKVKIGGPTGVLAKIAGKQPPDMHMWILKSDAPTFLKSEGPLYGGGPVWRIELATPSWPEEARYTGADKAH